MGKVRIKFRIEKLELEVEGEREDLPNAMNRLRQHAAGLIEAPTSVAGINHEAPSRMVTIESALPEKEAKARKTRNRSGGKSDDQKVSAIDFRHDPQQGGSPRQEWNTKEKAMWLLYALGKQTDYKELTETIIVETFNKHFRQAGMIRRGNVGRDLGKAKMQVPALVGEDTTKSPGTWFLTHEGEKHVQQLITAVQTRSA